LVDVANDLNMEISEDDQEDWDIYWIDSQIMPNFVMKMKSY